MTPPSLSPEAVERLAKLRRDYFGTPPNGISQLAYDAMLVVVDLEAQIRALSARLAIAEECIAEASDACDTAGFPEGARLARCIADLSARLEEAEHEWRTWGIIEIAVRNPNVSSYIDHWEGRALKAETQLGEAVALLRMVADGGWGHDFEVRRWLRAYDAQHQPAPDAARTETT